LVIALSFAALHRRGRAIVKAGRRGYGWPMTHWPDPENTLKIGTRGSPLALAQAHETCDRLMLAHGLSADAFEIVVIKTTGDRIIDRPLKEIGGKGLFTREIEDALLDGGIDIAVHSMKDMPVLQPDGLVIDCYLPRQDVRDAFVSPHHASIAALPQGAVAAAMVRSPSCRRARRSARPACAGARSWPIAAPICNWSSFAAMCRRG